MSYTQTYIPGKPSLAQLLRKIDDISTLPQIALRIMEVANNPNAGAADLKEVMECDAALSARVLRCVNSSAYAVRVRITNLQQAIAFLGLKQIRNLAMTAGVAEMFRKETRIGSYRRSELWRHLVAVGICARMIAMRRRMQNFEDAFLGGLLHDIGIILEDQYAHSAFEKILTTLNPAEETLCEAELRVLEFDHTVLGEKVTENWKFPEILRRTIRSHHHAAAYSGPDAALVQCVEAANLICTLKGISAVGMNLLRFSPATFAALDLKRDDIAVLSEDLDVELSRNASLFAM